MQPAAPAAPPAAPPRATTTALVVGPVLLLAGMILMGMPDLWTPSHLIFLAGTVAMLPAVVALHGRSTAGSPAWAGWSGLALSAAGALALAGQFVIDLVVMRLAADDREAAGELFDRIQASAAFELAFYSAGPSLLFLGLAVFGTLLILRAGRERWPGWAIIAGTLLMGAGRMSGLRLAEIAAGVLLVIAFARLAGAPAAARATTTRATAARPAA